MRLIVVTDLLAPLPPADASLVVTAAVNVMCRQYRDQLPR
jgi:hypothetical protein